MREAKRQARAAEKHEHSSDEEVLRESQKDPEVFSVLVTRYEAPFMRKALSILRVREDAEEIVQDAFTRIYLNAYRFVPQEGASFSSWGYAILIRLAFTRYQKLKKTRMRTADLEPEALERLPDQAAFLDELKLQDEVLVAFSRMPEAAARILRLQFLEGKSQEEIAAQEGSTVSAVKTRVHRAKKLFKEAITYDGTH